MRTSIFRLTRLRAYPHAGAWLGLLVFMLAPIPLAAQQKIQIEHADKLSYFEQEGRKYRKLIGAVRLRQENARMRCDSALQELDSNRVLAYGHVRYQEGDSLELFGDSLRYLGNRRLAFLKGHVRLVDGATQLTTDAITYRGRQKVAYYQTEGVVTDPQNRLVSQAGAYYTESKQAFFRDSVRLNNPKFRLEADTLQYATNIRTAYFLGPTWIYGDESTIFCRSGYYDTRSGEGYFGAGTRLYNDRNRVTSDSLYYQRERGYAHSRGYTTLYDSVEQLTLTGYKAEVFQQDSMAYITDSAQAQYPAGDDTLFVHADTIRATRDSMGQRLLKAYFEVRIWSRQMQGVCDSLIFRARDTQIVMMQQPALWQEQYQLTADTIKMYLGPNQLDSVDFIQNAFMCGRKDTSKYNQVRGKNMRAYFRENALRRIDVTGNGQAVYYLKDDNQPGYIGVNRIDASDVIIYVRDRELSEITFVREPHATLYPIDQAPRPETRLKGLNWRGPERPRSRRDLFRRPVASPPDPSL